MVELKDLVVSSVLVMRAVWKMDLVVFTTDIAVSVRRAVEVDVTFQ
jgi:hypothetical protein